MSKEYAYGFGLYIFIIVSCIGSFFIGFYSDKHSTETIFVRDTVLVTDTIESVRLIDPGCLYCPPGYSLGTFAGEDVCFDRDGWYSYSYPKPRKSTVAP